VVELGSSSSMSKWARCPARRIDGSISLRAASACLQCNPFD
jgi:hypothetical protein